jgi:hypothetical protein
VGCINAVLGIILPRFALLVAWYNDPQGWIAAIGSGFLLFAGWFFLPWTTLIYGITQRNGIGVIDVIFIVFAIAADVGTYGFGFLGGRKAYSSYRD